MKSWTKVQDTDISLGCCYNKGCHRAISACRLCRQDLPDQFCARWCQLTSTLQPHNPDTLRLQTKYWFIYWYTLKSCKNLNTKMQSVTKGIKVARANTQLLWILWMVQFATTLFFFPAKLLSELRQKCYSSLNLSFQTHCLPAPNNIIYLSKLLC